LCCEAVADRIVLAGEQRQEQTQAKPPPGYLGQHVQERWRQQLLPALLHHPQFAAVTGPDAGLEVLVGRIDLRRVPPWCLEVGMCWWSAVVVRRPRRIGERFWNQYRVLREVVAGWQRNLPHVVLVAGAVAEPVACHEL